MDHVGNDRQFDLSTEFKVGNTVTRKQRGQDVENLLGHVKEPTHSSALNKTHQKITSEHQLFKWHS